jgi:hypothetical protein
MISISISACSSFCFALVLVMILRAGQSSPPQQPDNKKESVIVMSEQFEVSARHLAAFEKTKNVKDLQLSLESAEGLAVVGAGDERVEARRKIAKLWLDILASIDRNLDHNFDPNNPPPERVTPPSSGAVSYPTGIDPKSISDPAARAQYEAALAENRRKTAQYRLQVKLRRIDPTAARYSDRFFSTQFTSAPQDEREFDSLLHAVKLSPTREQHLRAIFQKK